MDGIAFSILNHIAAAVLSQGRKGTSFNGDCLSSSVIFSPHAEKNY
ncbi:hypothetical protein SMITH_470 [Smithella sp. ME-1]|nr:hypothetical protein SMITH_470 [Smithella sp. ME-1]